MKYKFFLILICSVMLLPNSVRCEEVDLWIGLSVLQKIAYVRGYSDCETVECINSGNDYSLCVKIHAVQELKETQRAIALADGVYTDDKYKKIPLAFAMKPILAYTHGVMSKDDFEKMLEIFFNAAMAMKQ